jgi:hypothetical protein
MTLLLDLKLFKVAYDSLTIMGIETPESAKKLLHGLYLSNLDTNICERSQVPDELNQHSFMREISKLKKVKHPDEIRLYHLLSKMNRNIRMSSITEAQRGQVKRLRTIIRNMETAYYTRYGREIYEESYPAARTKRPFSLSAIQQEFRHRHVNLHFSTSCLRRDII